MKVEKSLKLAHTSSVAISLVLNAMLVAALLVFIQFAEPSERETTTVMVIDPVSQEDIEELEEEIEPEDVVDPDELDELVEFSLETPMDTNFEQETEVVEQVTNTDVTSLSELMSDVASPVVMTGLLVGRTPQARKAAAAKYGKGLERFTEPAVLKALEWLRDHQHENGSWTKDGNTTGGGYNTGFTGLALLTFLAHGETPASAEFGPTVAKGIRFLVENQDAKGILQPPGAHTGYGHAMGTYALAEAYTMTDNILLREPLRRAVKVIIDGQMTNGGYDYNYKNEARNDLSLGSWQLQALKAAYISKASGPDTYKYLQSAMDGMLLGSKETREGGRYFAYSVNGDNVGGANVTVSAAGTLALHLAGRAGSSEAKDAVDFLSNYTDKDQLPIWGSENPRGRSREIYYWYYAVQAFFQEDPDGSNFDKFMPSMVKALVQNQADDGHWLCYTESGEILGKTGNTCLAALGLMVFYRYLPTTQAENIRSLDAQPLAPEAIDEGDDVGFEI